MLNDILTHSLPEEPDTQTPLLDDPHVWLGLGADETAPEIIAAAARRRLDAICAACGSEQAVRDTVVAILVAARQSLLARAHGDASG
jgi:hypothetical protein